jgi:SAM-dependent methyltransferase
MAWLASPISRIAQPDTAHRPRHDRMVRSWLCRRGHLTRDGLRSDGSQAATGPGGRAVTSGSRGAHSEHGGQTLSVSDHYADGTYRWWHLSVPSPELLEAITEGWLPSAGYALDVGCGLGAEAAYLSGIGWRVVGVDLSPVAVAAAARLNPGPRYLRANLLRLPLQSSAFDTVLDRGCFHYLQPAERPGYAAELGRVLRPGGKLLLRPSLRADGVRNDIDEEVVRTVFGRWHIQQMTPATVPSDTRTLELLVVRLTT